MYKILAKNFIIKSFFYFFAWEFAVFAANRGPSSSAEIFLKTETRPVEGEEARLKADFSTPGALSGQHCDSS